MPAIYIIDCKRERLTKSFFFTLSMFIEASIAGNLAVFKDLNILQLGLEKTDTQ